MNVNKETLLTNSLLIESKLNDFLSTINNGMYKVECFYQVAAGRGFKKDQLMLTIYNVGQYGVNVNFNTDTLKLDTAKTIGKYDKETTKDMLNEAYWVYIMKLEKVLKGIVSELTNVIEVVEVTTVNNVNNENDTIIIENDIKFTNEEINNPTITRLIREHADTLTVETMLQRENIDLSNKRVSDWNRVEHDNWNYYYPIIETNIIDGTYADIILSIRNEYKEHKNKMDHMVMIEKSYELPDHEVPLNIFIERSNTYKGKLIIEHEKIIKNAIEKGLSIPDEVLKDYPHLTVTKETTSTYTAFNRSFSSYDAAFTYCNDSDFDPSYIVTEEPTMALPLDLQLFSNEDTKESFPIPSARIDSNGVWHKGIGKHLELIYIIETTKTDPNIDELNYSNFHEYKCYSMTECIKRFNMMQSRGWYNIQIMTRINYKDSSIIEDNSESQLEFDINNSIMDILKKENKRISELEDKLSLYQEFIAKYKSEKLFQSFVDEKENKIQAS